MQVNQTEKPTDAKKKKFLGILGKFLFYSFVMLLVIVFGAVGVGFGYASALVKDEPIRNKADFDKELEGWNQTSYAYFRDAITGQEDLIGKMHSEQDRQLITSVNDVNPYLIKAFLGIEDHSFYEHNGVVPRSIARALYQSLTGQEDSTGGSTLTQQLVKNEIIDDTEKSFTRKAKDIINAVRLEKYYTKDEIFVKYMNSAYFSKGANGKHMYGVYAAANGLFNKNVKDLNLPEAAYIAGMVQLPNVYNPFSNEKRLQNGIERMQLVLAQMKKFGQITEQEYQEAMKYDITKSLAKSEDFTNAYDQYPFIISAIEREAIDILKSIDKKNGVKQKSQEEYEKLVSQGGYHFYTSIDKAMYDSMNAAGDKIKRPTRNYTVGSGKKKKTIKVEEQVGAVVVRNTTGEVLSFYAGKDFSKNQMDFAFKATNQPGSTFKPILAYGPALNEGIISPSSPIVDEPLQKRGSSKVYVNANNKYSGTVTATKALTWSYNIPAIKIYRSLENKLGKAGLQKYLTRMGVPAHKNDGEALVLGGSTNGYTVAQMTGAYQTIANNGSYIKPHLITKITDASGNVIYDANQTIKPDQVFKPSAAAQLQRMMRQVITTGTATRIGASTGGYNVIGKTGTTSSQYDLWFAGSTPEISMAVWSGYEYNFKASDNMNKDAWIKFFNAIKSKKGLLKPGASFTDPGGTQEDFKCFECNRVVPPTDPNAPDNQPEPTQNQNTTQKPKNTTQSPNQPDKSQTETTTDNQTQEPTQTETPSQTEQPQGTVRRITSLG